MGVCGWPHRRRVGLRRVAPRRAKPLCAQWRAAHDNARHQRTAPDHYWCGAAITMGGVSNVDIDGNNALQIKAIGVVISTFETLPTKEAAHVQHQLDGH